MEKNRLEIIRERFEKWMNKNVGKPDIYVKNIADFYEKEITSLLEEVEGEIKDKINQIDEEDQKLDDDNIPLRAVNLGKIYALEEALQILKSKRNQYELLHKKT